MQVPVDIKRMRFILESVDFISRERGRDCLDILDVGCGRGKIALTLAKRGHHILGIDIDVSNIRLASQRNKYSNAVFQVLDAHATDRLGQKFDVIICSEALEHVDDPEGICNKIARVIRPGGILIITVPNGLGPYEVLYETPIRLIRRFLVQIGLLEDLRPGQEHKTNFTLGRLKRLLTKTGFRIVNFSNSDFISFLFFLRKTNFARLDCRLADLLPYFMASGWYVVGRFEGYPEETKANHCARKM